MGILQVEKYCDFCSEESPATLYCSIMYYEGENCSINVGQIFSVELLYFNSNRNPGTDFS